MKLRNLKNTDEDHCEISKSKSFSNPILSFNNSNHIFVCHHHQLSYHYNHQDLNHIIHHNHTQLIFVNNASWHIFSSRHTFFRDFESGCFKHVDIHKFSLFVMKLTDTQWCIIRLTCSHPELTKDHVLISAYVIIFGTVARNAVNKSV